MIRISGQPESKLTDFDFPSYGEAIGAKSTGCGHLDTSSVIIAEHKRAIFAQADLRTECNMAEQLIAKLEFWIGYDFTRERVNPVIIGSRRR